MKWVSHADDTEEGYCCNYEYNKTNALLTKSVFTPHHQNAVPEREGAGRVRDNVVSSTSW
jgi:hypothetical protein